MSFWQEDWLGFGPLMNFLSSDQWESVEDKQVSVSQAFAEDGLLNLQLVEDEIRNIIHPKVAGMKDNDESAFLFYAIMKETVTASHSSID